MKQPSKSVFGCYLEELRRERGWTQRFAADQIGIDATYYYKIERGDMSPPSDPVIARMAQIFGIAEEDLFNRSGKVPAQLKQALHDTPYLSELIWYLSRHPLSAQGYQDLLQRATLYG